MERNDFLNAIIDDSIYEITISYTHPNQQTKKVGAIAGLEACRGKTDAELLTLRDDALIRTMTARGDDDTNYWWARCYELQVEWVLNVISAVCYTKGLEVLVPVTAKGVLKAIDILNPKT